jgi:hypothetical protein
MARGQDGFASPFLYDSFIHYFTPVYPDAIQGGALYYLRPVSLRAAQIFSGDLAGLIKKGARWLRAARMVVRITRITGK